MNSRVFRCEDFISFLLLEDMPEHRQPLCSAGSVLFPALCSPGSSPVKSIITSLIAPGLYPSQDIATASSLSHCKQLRHPSLALRPWSLLLCGCLSSSLHQIFSLYPQSPAFSTPPLSVPDAHSLTPGTSMQDIARGQWSHSPSLLLWAALPSPMGSGSRRQMPVSPPRLYLQPVVCPCLQVPACPASSLNLFAGFSDFCLSPCAGCPVWSSANHYPLPSC